MTVACVSKSLRKRRLLCILSFLISTYITLNCGILSQVWQDNIRVEGIKSLQTPDIRLKRMQFIPPDELLPRMEGSDPQRLATTKVNSSTPPNYRSGTLQQNLFIQLMGRCASSTLTSIMLGYGVSNGINMNYQDSEKTSMTSSMSGLQGITMSKIRFKDRKWHQEATRNTVFITALRHPAYHLESVYMTDLAWCTGNKANFSVFTRWKTYQYLTPYILQTICKPKQINVTANIRNMMSHQLGMDEKYMDDSQAITQFIKTIDRQFQMVLILEHLDESLVILKDVLGWELDDVITFGKHIRVTENRSIIAPGNLTDIREWSKADHMLYEHFKQKLQLVISSNEPYIYSQVQELRRRRRHAYEKCMVRVIRQRPDNVSHRTDVLEYKSVVSKLRHSDTSCMLKATNTERLIELFVNNESLATGWMGANPMSPSKQLQ